MASVKPLVTSTSTGLPEPVTAPTNGQVLIGDGSGYTAATLTAGSNVTITNGPGSVTIAASGGGGGGLTNWTEAVSTSSPNATVPVTSFTATNAATNVDAALVTKGTGAILAQVPDGTITGGNKRGAYALDFQRSRNNAVQVASGQYSALLTGYNNSANNDLAVVIGGSTNNASGYGSTIVGGYSNNAAGPRAVVMTGSGHYVGGDGSVAVSGYGAFLLGSASVMLTGAVAVDNGTANRVMQAGFSPAYDKISQSSTHVTTALTTDATPTNLRSNALAVSASNTLALRAKASYAFRTLVVAESTAGDRAAWVIQGLIYQDATAATTTMLGGPISGTSIGATAGAAGWSVVADANTTYGTLVIRGTGAVGATINWTATTTTAEANH